MPYTSPKPIYSGRVKTLTHGASGRGFDDMGVMTMMSDLRATESIVRVGCHIRGFGLSPFDDRPAFREDGGWGRHFGVLAQKVERVMPDADD